jgi:hypothetical protein
MIGKAAEAFKVVRDVNTYPATPLYFEGFYGPGQLQWPFPQLDITQINNSTPEL